MEKYKKKNIKKEEIISKIRTKINLMMSFGQTPHQIFYENHPKYGKKIKNKEGDFEFELNNIFWNRHLKLVNELNPLFFIINNNGKILLIDKNKKLEIIENTLYNQKEDTEFQFIKYGTINIPYIEFFDKLEYTKNDNKKINNNNNIKDIIITPKKDNKIYSYYILKQKYSIASFEEKMDYNKLISLSETSKDNENHINNNNTIIKENSKDKIKEKENSKTKEKINKTISTQFSLNNMNINPEYTSEISDNNYNLYTTNYIMKLKYQKLKLEKKSKDYLFKFITCRHIDNSFKIYFIPLNKSLKKDIKPLSYICESFVSCVNIISYNKFIIGLKNGKIMIFSLLISKNNNSNTNSDIKIFLNKQIKGHQGNITFIEINERLGLILSGGDDNYIFIRKVYDMELLIPIKFKKKYIITTAKISPMNFLYVICFNIIKKKSVIFGYTLNGIRFAKSKYEYYDTLDFTKNGNIVTWINKRNIVVLYGDSLNKNTIHKKDEKRFKEIKNKIVNASWIKFDYFDKKYLEVNTRIITYTTIENNNNVIKTCDVSDISYFD